jgi:hypothetical protein
VVDWANAAPEVSNEAAIKETARRLFIVSSSELMMRLNHWKRERFQFQCGSKKSRAEISTRFQSQGSSSPGRIES